MIDTSVHYDLPQLGLGLSLSQYLYRLGFVPFPWQVAVAKSPKKRVILLCSRQAGKSTFVSSIPCHTAKYEPGSLNIVMAPTEDQAVEDMLKVKDFIAHDPTYPALERDGADIIQLANGSRIIIVVATDRAARGYSRPRTVLLDEASRIPDIVYKSGVVPMMNHNPDGRLYMLSTPFGQTGFFYDTWVNKSAERWDKFFVRTPWDTDEENPTALVPAMPEEEMQALYAKQGIKAFYSPNHADYQEQLSNLEDVGIKQYQQEFCCDFIEMNGMVFSYADLANLFKNTAPARQEVSNENFVPTQALQPRSIGGRFF